MSQRDNTIRSQTLHAPRVTRMALWFGLLGGGAAWLVHLLSAYFCAEFGCVSGLGHKTAWSISIVAWIILGISALTLAVAVAATFIAYRSREKLAVESFGETADGGAEFELARTGFITSMTFAFIIAVETIPIFFYLRTC